MASPEQGDKKAGIDGTGFATTYFIDSGLHVVPQGLPLVVVNTTRWNTAECGKCLRMGIEWPWP